MRYALAAAAALILLAAAGLWVAVGDGDAVQRPCKGNHFCPPPPPPPPPPAPPPPPPPPAPPPPPPTCSGVTVTPSVNIQSLINGNPAGTTFCFTSGKYRLTAALTPKSSDVFDGQDQATLDGAKDISGLFTVSGANWVATNQTQDLSYTGVPCEPAKPLCQRADDVFLDGTPLERVGSVAALGPGKFYFDQAGNSIYIRDNPSGHLIEATVAVEAFHGIGTGTDSVVWKRLTVQHFGQHGIQCRGFTDHVDHSTIRWNHGDGLQDCPQVTFSTLDRNGKDGYVFGGHIGDTTGPYAFTDNTVTSNNYAGYDPNWEAGGAKFMQMSHLNVSRNTVRDNDGVGLWTDWGNQYVTYDANILDHNASSGIFHEASYDATISNNRFVGNGAVGCSGTLCDAGLFLNDSQNVEVFGNYLEGNANGIGFSQTERGSTILGDLVTANDYVHDNTVFRSGESGIVDWDELASYSANNRFAHNTYTVCGDPVPFVWRLGSSYGNLSWGQWQQVPQDATGSFTGC